MKALFKDIMSMPEVKGVVLISFEGGLVYKEIKPSLSQAPDNMDWQSMLSELDGVREADITFENGRVYFRRTGLGYLMIISQAGISGAMLRLNCDIIMPSLKSSKQSRKLKRFFKK
jgi:hypothetical protein